MSTSEVSLQLSKVFTVATHFKTTPPPLPKKNSYKPKHQSHTIKEIVLYPVITILSTTSIEKKNIFQHVSYFGFFFGNSGYIGELRVGCFFLLSKLDDEVYHLQGRWRSPLSWMSWFVKCPYYSPPFGSGDRHLLSPQSNAFVMFFEACTIPYDSYTRRSLCQNHTNSLLSSKSCSSLQKQKQ